jgi:hypothetical protein
MPVARLALVVSKGNYLDHAAGLSVDEVEREAAEHIAPALALVAGPDSRRLCDEYGCVFELPHEGLGSLATASQVPIARLVDLAARLAKIAKPRCGH